MTYAQAVEIRKRYAEGDVSQAALGREYGVSQRAVSAIVRGEAHSVAPLIGPRPSPQREWYRRNREQMREGFQQRMKDDPDYRRKQHFKQRYGLTLEEVDQLHAAQGGRCAACGDSISLGAGATGAHVDHCHDEDRVRGLLCPGCNQALGLLRDNPDRIAGLLRYLTGR